MRNVRKILLFFFVSISVVFISHTVIVRSNSDLLKETTKQTISDDVALVCKSKLHDDDVSIQCSKCIMTVFIHGTIGPHFSFKAIGSWFKSIFRKKEKKIGVFQRYIEQVKRYSFHRFQPINTMGLIPIDLDTKLSKGNIGYIGQQTAILYKKLYDKIYSDNKNDIAFYTFGWTGRLSKRLRREAATELYDSICQEAERLRNKTCKPVEVWLLAHSHGVNVMLNLEEEEKVQKKNLIIDKAIFYGGPIQSETEDFVKSTVFKDIYHIYSRGDHIQRLDCVSTKDWFSRQTFGSNKKKQVAFPKNLNQIEVEIGDCKPYHYELWLWGMKNFPYYFYRRRMSLFPLPVSVFSPVIISLVDSIDVCKCKDNCCYLRIDGDSGEFVLHGFDKQVCQIIDTKTLRKEGRAAL